MAQQNLLQLGGVHQLEGELLQEGLKLLEEEELQHHLPGEVSWRGALAQGGAAAKGAPAARGRGAAAPPAMGDKL